MGDMFQKAVRGGGLGSGPQSGPVEGLRVTKVPKDGPEFEAFLKYVEDLSSRVFVAPNDDSRMRANGGLEWAIDAESARIMSRGNTCDFYQATKDGAPVGFGYVMWAKTLSDNEGIYLPESRGFAWSDYVDNTRNMAPAGQIFLPNSRLFDWGEGYDFEPSASLQYLAVEPELRRQGLGKALLDQIVSDMKQKGVSYVFLTVDRRNDGARKFFEAQNFAADGETVVDDYNLQGGAPTDKDTHQVVWLEYMRELNR